MANPDKAKAVRVARAEAIKPAIKAMDPEAAYCLKEAFYDAASGLRVFRETLTTLAVEHEPASVARLVKLGDRAGVLARKYEIDKLVDDVVASDGCGPLTTELIGALLAEAAFDGSCLGRIL